MRRSLHTLVAVVIIPALTAFVTTFGVTGLGVEVTPCLLSSIGIPLSTITIVRLAVSVAVVIPIALVAIAIRHRRLLGKGVPFHEAWRRPNNAQRIG